MSYLDEIRTISVEINNEEKVIFPFGTTMRLRKNMKYSISLLNVSMTYSWYNITEKFNNNKFKFFNPTTQETTELTIEPGMHDCETLNFHMKRYFKEPNLEKLPIVFFDYPATNRICITLNEGWKIDFTGYEIANLLGFKNKVYDEIDNRGDLAANINRDVRLIFVHCNLAKGAYIFNRKTKKLTRSDVIYFITPSKAPGEGITIEPNSLIPYPIDEEEISEITFYLTDQFERPIDLNGDTCSLTFHITTEKIN